MNKYEQDDDDKLYRAFDWQEWLATDETILTYDVTCDDDDLVITEVSLDDALVKYKVEGGIAGRRYTISCMITTSGGQTIQRSIFLQIGKL